MALELLGPLYIVVDATIGHKWHLSSRLDPGHFKGRGLGLKKGKRLMYAFLVQMRYLPNSSSFSEAWLYCFNTCSIYL